MKYDHDKIESLINAGLIAQHIAEQIGCTSETVRNVAKQRGLVITTRVSKGSKSRNSGPRAAARKFDYSEIKNLLDSGLSKKDVCTQLGMHPNSLRYVLRTNGWAPKCVEKGCTERRWLNAKRCEQHATMFRLTRVAAYGKAWREDNPGYQRQRTTGFTPEMFEECLVIQEGKCGLCFIDLETLATSQVHADHVPRSNPPKPRGVLCGPCNTRRLGFVEAFEIAGDCKITSPQLLEWQEFPPMSRSSFAEELGWTRPIL